MALSARAHESSLSKAKGKAVPEQLQPIALQLLPLIEPYKRHPRLTLRVERLPAKARFSAGSRAGDRSWSLSREDLDNLNYLVPAGVDLNHSVSVRIIELERGDTLAVHEVKIDELLAAEGPAACHANNNNELARLKSALATAEAKLEIALSEMERQKCATKTAIERELDAAMAAWKFEEDTKFAMAEADWQARTIKAIEDTKTQFHALIEQSQLDTAMVLESEKQQWKLEEATRIEGLKAQWREQSENVLFQARTEAQHIPVRAEVDIEAERATWQREEHTRFAAAEVKWKAETAKAISDTKAQFETIKSQWQRESAIAIETAKRDLKAGETARIDALKALWEQELKNAESAREVALAAVTNGDTISELETLKQSLSDFKAQVSVRDSQLVEMRKSLELALTTKSSNAPQIDEPNHMAAIAQAVADAEACWQAQSALELNSALLRAQAAEDALSMVKQRSADDRRLETELNTLRVALAARETETQQALMRAPIERATEPGAQPALPSNGASKGASQRSPIFSRAVLVAAAISASVAIAIPELISYFRSDTGVQTASVLPTSTAAPSAPVQIFLPTAVVKKNSRLRAAPGKTEIVLVRLERGVEVRVLESREAWMRVQMNYKTRTIEGWTEKAALTLPDTFAASKP